MLRYRGVRIAILIALGLAAGTPNRAGLAQIIAPGSASLAPPAVLNSLPAAGGWAQVLTVDANWMVLQNEQRQQYPVSFRALNVFLMRWPITLADVSPAGVLEAYGATLPSNGVQTDHIDVYEGSDRDMVQPTGIPYVNTNQLLTMAMLNTNNNMGTYYPNSGVFPGMLLHDPIPTQTRIAGPLAGIDPILIGTSGQNVHGVVPSPGGMTITQVTRGAIPAVEKGDLVFFVPGSATTKTVQMDFFIVYKKYPFKQFQLMMSRRR